MTTFPTTWMTATLGDLTKDTRPICYGVLKPGPFDSSGVPLLRIQDLIGNKISVDNVHYISKQLDSEFHRSKLKGGEVLLSVQGTIGRTAIVPESLAGANISRTLALIEPPTDLKPRFLYYYLQHLTASGDYDVGGSTRASLNIGTIREMTVPVPPLEEQERIVTAIEEQFSRIDAGVAGLERIRHNIRRYRVSLLSAAMSGLLGRPSATMASKWETTNIGSICECLDSRRKPVNKKERLIRHGSVPYFGANGQVGWIDDYLFDEPLVLVVEDETFTGRTKPFSYMVSGRSWVNNHAHVLRATSRTSVAFLNYALAYYPFTPLTTGTTGRRKLTKTALLNAPISLPPKDEQDRLVKELDRRISVADRIEVQVNNLLNRTATLRSSILKWIFSGEVRLTPFADAPDSVLRSRSLPDADPSVGGTIRADACVDQTGNVS